MRSGGSEQKNLMRKVEPQRRREIIDGEIRPIGGDMDWQFAVRHRGNRRQVRLERKNVRSPAAQVEKDAPQPLTFVPAVMLLVAAAHVPSAAVRVRLRGRRRDRAGLVAVTRTGVRVMPAAAEHRVQRHQQRHQR